MFYDFKFYDLKRFMFLSLDVFSSLTFEMFRNSWGGYLHAWENGDSSTVRAPDSWSKGRGFESWQERLENFLLQGQLAVLTLTSVSVPPPCYRSRTRRRPRSFCQKCRWQVTAKTRMHPTYVVLLMIMKNSDIVQGCIVYTARAETAAVSRGTSHVTTKHSCKYTTSVDIHNAL